MSSDSEYRFPATHDDLDVVLETFHVLEPLHASIAMPVYGRAYKLHSREWNHTVTADKILGPAWFLDLPVISSLNVVPPKVLVSPRWHSQIDDTPSH